MAKHAVFEGRSEDDYADSVNESWLEIVLPPIQPRVQKRDRSSSVPKSVLYLLGNPAHTRRTPLTVAASGGDPELEAWARS